MKPLLIIFTTLFHFKGLLFVALEARCLLDEVSNVIFTKVMAYISRLLSTSIQVNAKIPCIFGLALQRLKIIHHFL